MRRPSSVTKGLPVISNPLTRLIISLTLVFSTSNVYSVAKAHVPVGTPVSNQEMPLLTGGKAPLLKDVEANVLVFFRPSEEHSVSALKELAKCQANLPRATVNWMGVVSSSASVDAVTATLRETGFGFPVLIDPDNQLYGRLEMAQHPAVAIIGRDKKLAAFEPFRKINYCAVVTARIRHLLREISDADMAAVLSPPRATQGGAVQVARRYRAFAENLFKDKKYDGALDNVRKSLEKDPQLAIAHELLGQILAAQDKCPEAVPAFNQALAIDATLAGAKEGLERCKAAR